VTVQEINAMSDNNFGTKSSADTSYQSRRLVLAELLRKSPIPDAELTANLGLYVERMHLSRILLIHDLYRRIIRVPGVILEFGVRWGQNLALFNAFRGMYEPYNYTRKVVGFDSFAGFPSVSAQDQSGAGRVDAGNYGVSDGWQQNLEALLQQHELLSPLSHIRKTELVVGDATKTFPEYLRKHPELLVSLAYFDFDIYQPTKECLELLLRHVPKGALVVFDELNCPEFPGETIAVQEVLGIRNLALERDPNNPYVSWFENR
jgi:hypothetical protein